MNEEQKAAYLADNWDMCPVCLSGDIEGDAVQAEGGQAWQNIECNECGHKWRDVYTLTGVEDQ
jgi:formate dehydrogenase maturation protein FdhE